MASAAWMQTSTRNEHFQELRRAHFGEERRTDLCLPVIPCLRRHPHFGKHFLQRRSTGCKIGCCAALPWHMNAMRGPSRCSPGSSTTTGGSIPRRMVGCSLCSIGCAFVSAKAHEISCWSSSGFLEAVLRHLSPRLDWPKREDGIQLQITTNNYVCCLSLFWLATRGNSA